MRAIHVLASIVATIALAACGSASDAEEGDPAVAGVQGQRIFEVGSFDGISLGGHYDVIVKVGPAVSVRAEGDAAEIDRMKVEVKNGDLHIGTRNDGRFRVAGRSGRVTVHVTVPALRSAAIGGSGDMKIDRVEGDSFAASIGGSGDILVDALQVASANFSIAGSGGIKATGSARDSDISVAGSGGVNLAGLESRTASVSIVGSGDVRARATESASVSIMGSGNVVMGGPAKCSVTKMGSGSVRCNA